jgi:hypothetical protein
VNAKSKRIAGKPHPTSIQLTEVEREMLRKLAERENRSVSGQLRHLIAEAAERQAA